MSFPTLTRGERGEEVRKLRGWLNRIGAMLVTDGIFGGGSVRGVTYAQDFARQLTTGMADAQLWAWLEQQPEPHPSLNTEGVSMIARDETGGLRYYDQHTHLPHYSGEASGATIGVGYDLRFNTEADFRAQWPPSCQPR